MAGDLSLEKSSTIIISVFSQLCAKALSIAREIVSWALKQVIPMVIKGRLVSKMKNE